MRIIKTLIFLVSLIPALSFAESSSTITNMISSSGFYSIQGVVACYCSNDTYDCKNISSYDECKNHKTIPANQNMLGMYKITIPNQVNGTISIVRILGLTGSGEMRTDYNVDLSDCSNYEAVKNNKKYVNFDIGIDKLGKGFCFIETN